MKKLYIRFVVFILVMTCIITVIPSFQVFAAEDSSNVLLISDLYAQHPEAEVVEMVEAYFNKDGNNYTAYSVEGWSEKEKLDNKYRIRVEYIPWVRAGGSGLVTYVYVSVITGFAAFEAPNATEGVKLWDSNGVDVCVNWKDVLWPDAVPFVNTDKRTMVPLRAVANDMGLSVEWDRENRTAVFSDGRKTIRFPLDSKMAYTSDGAIQMDTAAVIINNRTYAPIRYLAEYFGWTVMWVGDARTVWLTKK